MVHRQDDHVLWPLLAIRRVLKFARFDLNLPWLLKRQLDDQHPVERRRQVEDGEDDIDHEDFCFPVKYPPDNQSDHQKYQEDFLPWAKH